MSAYKTHSDPGDTKPFHNPRAGLESGRPLRKRSSRLLVSASALALVQTTASKPAFAVLTLKQPDSHEPVTLTTDAPDYFLLAADSRPAFLPNLTLTPDAKGTYIHVRYFAASTGGHTGQLTIQQGHETRTVALTGQKTGLLPVLQTNWPVIRKAAAAPWPGQVLTAKYLIPLVVLPVLMGIAYAVITHRSQPVSVVHRPVNGISPTNGPLPGPSAKSAPDGLLSVKKPTKIRKSSGNATVPADEKTAFTGPSTRSPAAEATLKISPAATPDQKTERVAAAGRPISQAGTGTQKTERQRRKKQRRIPDASASARRYDTSESELERLLNHP